MSRIEVTLPWPAPQVFPNYRNGNHWRKSWKQVKKQRETAFILAAEQIGRQTVPRDRSGQWPVHLDIYPPDNIKRDEDGMVGACKAAIDGLSAALRVDDSLFGITHTIHPPRRPDGAVVITVTAPEAVSNG